MFKLKSSNSTEIEINTNYSNHLGYIRGIAEALPIKNEICNIVISITAVHNFTNIAQGIDEIRSC